MIDPFLNIKPKNTVREKLMLEGMPDISDYEAIRYTLMWLSPLMNRRLGQAEPPDEYKRDGLLVYADGDDWDPGSGKGLYRYDTDTSSWVFIG